MPVEQLTYAEIGGRWGISSEAARKRVRALRLVTTTGNDGKARTMIDFADLTPHREAPSPQGGPPAAIAAMTTRIAILEVELAEARSQLALERQRVDVLIAACAAPAAQPPSPPRPGFIARLRTALRA